MPWYSPWSDHIAKSVCKYLLQRYLGQFLEEKLTLDQLTVDLYKGIGVISNVALDVQALNEVAEEQSIPFEFIDGFIEKMSVSVPWASIFNDATNIQVEGLSLTLKKMERNKPGISMFESMWSSMTSSMQLAEDCLRSERNNSQDGSQTFEGIESFAHTIDSILSRIKVKFSGTMIRIEETLNDCNLGVAFQVNIKQMEYFDEGAMDSKNELESDFQLPAFSSKKINVEGVTLYSNEFQVSFMSDSKISVTGKETEENFVDENKSKDNKNILIGRFAGRQEITMKFKQSVAEGPKVDLQVSLGALTVFLSPHQIHGLLKLIKGMTPCTQNTRFRSTNPNLQKPMVDSDFLKIEQELQTNLNWNRGTQAKGLGNQGWANTCLESSECEFTPLHDTHGFNDSVLSSSSSLNGSVSSGSSRSSFGPNTGFFIQSGNPQSDTNTMVFHFHLLLSSLTLIFLHEDILTESVDSCQSSVGRSSFEEMRRLANDFFDRLGLFMASGYGKKDFDKANQIFPDICQLNHIRITAAPVIIEGNECSTMHTTTVKGICSSSKFEILECLLEKDTQSQGVKAEYVELLKFKNEATNYDGSRPPFSQPNVTINFKLVQNNSSLEKNRKYVRPRSEFLLEFQPFNTEVDITIVDRLSALLNPGFYFSKNLHHDLFTNPSTLFNKEQFQLVVDAHSVPAIKYIVQINASFITFKIRFPVPDLRPQYDMDKTPWWKRCVRKDILFVDVTDFVLNTTLEETETVFKFETQCKNLVFKFKESDSEEPIDFAKASAIPNSNSDTRKFGWPRIVIHVYPKGNPSCLEESDISSYLLKPMHHTGFQSLVSSLESTSKKESSPFSCKKVIHESDTPHTTTSSDKNGEELVIPGDSAEIADFIDSASLNTRIKIEVLVPAASIFLPSKHFYEVIYNRISTDLLLWEPSAPVRETCSTKANFDLQRVFQDCGPSFSLCKSGIQCDSDSETESQDGIFYSAYENKQRHKKKESLERKNMSGQSKVVVQATVLQGLLDLHAPVRDSQGKVIPRQHGQLLVSFDDGNLFLAAGHKGKSDLDYFCLQINHFSFYHNGLVGDSLESTAIRQVGSSLPEHLELIVQKTGKSALLDQSTAVGTGFSTSSDMLTVSVQTQKHNSTLRLKTFRVAIGIREATLRHKIYKDQSSWFSQMIDFFDVIDYPIAGYDPSSILSEINLHLWSCSVDYRPINLPLKCLLHVGSFNISSNIAAQTSSSTLRFIAEESAFFISNKSSFGLSWESPDLRKDYICVTELGLFELSLRLSEKTEITPKIDLRASANEAHVRTCSDSAKALAELLMYYASDGDLISNDNGKESFRKAEKKCETKNEDQVLVKTGETEPAQALSRSQVALVNNLMEEAMKESKTTDLNLKQAKETSASIHCEESPANPSKKLPKEGSLGVEFSEEDDCHDFEEDDAWEKEFCIVQNEAGMGMMPKKGLPEVRNLTSGPVRLIDNHFSVPLGKADLLRSPKHYPKPVLRYMLREMSLVWHMYGGSDFEIPSGSSKDRKESSNSSSDSKQVNVSSLEGMVAFSKNSSGVEFKYKNEPIGDWKQKGGRNRRHDVLMELQLNKIRFQHEVYPENTPKASRQVLLIQDVELRDRLASSTINKFLYQYSSETKPKQSQAPMVVVKSVLIRSDPKINAQECCLKVSLLPLRLNIDQDSVLFLYQFFSELSVDDKEEEENARSRAGTPKHQVPVMTVDQTKKSDVVFPEPTPLLIDLEGEDQKKIMPRPESQKTQQHSIDKASSQPLFFRCFIFSPEVPVKLDYQGKRVDMSRGSLAGILMGLGQLNNSELKLRKISYRHGLLGFDKLINFVLSEWANDIKKNQLPSLLGGVGPMHTLVQLIQGIRDLIWLPIEQYQRDGRLVRGFQRGANSFTTSTAMASLELISRLIQIIQSTAETAYDMVSPGPSVKTSRKRSKGKAKRYSQPADIREGMAIAYLVVKEGIGETAETIVRVASEEHEQKGVTGAVGGVLRQIPPTVVKPIILATEATNNVIGGMRSQLVPDARKEAVEKWRKQDS